MKKPSNQPRSKPNPSAKALSLFLMAYKNKDPKYKEELKRINKKWDLFQAGELFEKVYLKEVDAMLIAYGGYESVIEKTVQYYLDKTGEWTTKGDDQYARDAQAIAEKILGNNK